MESPLGRNVWCFLLQQTLQTLSMVLSPGCRKQRAWLCKAEGRSVSYIILQLNSELMIALTPGLLKADNVYTTHGCHLHNFTNPAVHGIDLWGGTSRVLAFTLQVFMCCFFLASNISPDLVKDGGISGQNNAMLDESHPDPSGWPQLFLGSFKPVTPQLKVTLRRSLHSTCWELQIPVTQKRYISIDSL